MCKTEVSYICDCCGKKVSIEWDVINQDTAPEWPDTWKYMIEPFNLCCDGCMSQFMDVYERIRKPKVPINN